MSRSWLVDLVPARQRRRVAYLFPHAGAGVGAVRALGLALAPWLHPVAVRLPGREALLDEPALTDLPEIAGLLADAVHAHAGTDRIVLFGHSSGAVLAYETARALEPQQAAVLFAASAQRAPTEPPRTAAGCWSLPDEEFFAQVAADGYLPAELLAEPDLLRMVAPALRADYRATHEHLAGTSRWTPLTSPVLTLRGAEDDTVTQEEVSAWSALTTAGHTTALLPGGHNLLRDCPDGLADALGKALP